LVQVYKKELIAIAIEELFGIALGNKTKRKDWLTFNLMNLD
jgi:hypothetical protein